ncbi:protein of unknown function [Xenorhabdus doucetiae]|uniref:Uncharacterized protein n=1 Tax=Xenorhabdus doucetiae TaxID=351671 RepID=A0A068QVK3_9GAMM|nr:protein of unknown function [Xenorhabdus doucetiae]
MNSLAGRVLCLIWNVLLFVNEHIMNEHIMNEHSIKPVKEINIYGKNWYFRWYSLWQCAGGCGRSAADPRAART